MTQTKESPASFAHRALEALEAAIEGRASQSMLSLSIAGKAIQMMSLAEQMEVRGQLLREIAANKRQMHGKSPIQTMRIRL